MYVSGVNPASYVNVEYFTDPTTTTVKENDLGDSTADDYAVSQYRFKAY